MGLPKPYWLVAFMRGLAVTADEHEAQIVQVGMNL